MLPNSFSKSPGAGIHKLYFTPLELPSTPQPTTMTKMRQSLWLESESHAQQIQFKRSPGAIRREKANIHW